MITRFHVENFKSLADFDLPADDSELSPFTCLIGLNGSGKSTLLQALDFAAHLVVPGGIKDWLEQRNWKASDIVTGLGKHSPVVTFKVGFRDADGRTATWHARYNTNQPRCTYERVETAEGVRLLELEADRLFYAGANGEPKRRPEKLGVVYQGSVLSILELKDAHPLLSFVQESLLRLKSLELLSPHLLRKRGYVARDIGAGGEKLSAFLAGLAADQKQALLATLREFYPHLKEWRVKSITSGWKDLRFQEDYAGAHLVPAAHINDGMLRVMAILTQAQAHKPPSFLLLDEIENGINPELVEKLMDFLVQLGQQGKQVMVTTHSPVILNFLEDDVARRGVMLLYKTRDGRTRSCRYFDQPETGYKLQVLGPGEVFVDTDLTKMVDRLDRAATVSISGPGGRP